VQKNPEPAKETKKNDSSSSVKGSGKASTVEKDEYVEVRKTPIRDFFRNLRNR